ncbi:Zinc_finger C2H2-type [Hexamita inflata]|uniref:Zinc finger C2H2-type n=1 Tax=Hexamita inflata TaxID=28002 RepID=A0AA86U1C9_9EUKA|nr:Zinc finger C2H2-type [Hexamita inflata]
MSLYKKLGVNEPLNDDLPEMSEESTESSISEGREKDIAHFIECLREKERRMHRLQKMAKSKYKYYCQCCAYACIKNSEMEEHAKTEEHIKKDKEWEKFDHDYQQFDKSKRNSANKIIKAERKEHEPKREDAKEVKTGDKTEKEEKKEDIGHKGENKKEHKQEKEHKEKKEDKSKDKRDDKKEEKKDKKDHKKDRK